MEPIAPKKSLGQNFLNNTRIPELMADAGEVQKGDTVLEIGPGTGMLTREFLIRGASVIAIEADIRAMEVLKGTFGTEIGSGSLTLIHSDIREINLESLGLQPHSYKLIANIPYYLSGFLFRTFLESPIQPKTLVFLTQKEVAERIARDKKESLLSLGVKAYGDPKYVKTVARGNFNPSPKVDSAIIKVGNISKDRIHAVPEVFFFEILHLAFAAKRKQLLGNLAKQFNRNALIHIFSELTLKEDVRAEDVPLETWQKLTEALFLHTKSTR